MNKRNLAILARAFEAQVNAAISGGFDLIQARSNAAEKLVADGYLVKATEKIMTTWPPITVTGYRLTMLGHAVYCMSCELPEEQTK